MSTHKDQTKAVSDQDTEGPAAPIIFFFIIGFAASLVIGWGIFPKLLYSQKHQPIDFNHAVHVEEVDDGCESCHYFREDGSFSGIPDLESCMECHEDVIGASEEEEKFVEEYVVPEREVPWLVYSRQPDCVYFSHAPHVIAGKMACAECHGHIGESDHARVYEENRITGYSRDIWGKNMIGIAKNPWERMKMDDCSKCHVRENVNQGSVQTQKGGCFVCHK
ncbi:MAG: cytochrome C [Deltaproteobacteria bacterium]|nr:cytochrome C [Deltaproteobacteria bacterium]